MNCLSKFINSFEVIFSIFKENKRNKHFMKPLLTSFWISTIIQQKYRLKFGPSESFCTAEQVQRSNWYSYQSSLWKFLPSSNFSNLHNLMLQYSCKFPLIYICKQAFSIMNIVTMKFQSTLTDHCFKNLMLLVCSKMEPNIEQITSLKQIQLPHYKQFLYQRSIREWTIGAPTVSLYVIFILHLYYQRKVVFIFIFKVLSI